MPPAVIGAIISGGAALGGAAISSHGQTTAADKQAEAIEKGIDLQKQMYEQDRADFAPYRGLGAGAVGNLAYLGGINLPPPESPAAPPTTAPAAPLTSSTLAQLGPRAQANSPNGAFYLPGHGGVLKSSAVNQSGLIKVQSPSGTVHLVPPDQLAIALQRGGKRV